MDKNTERRLRSLKPTAISAANRQAAIAAERARVEEILRRHGADPAQGIGPNGFIIGGDKAQYIGMMKTFASCELGNLQIEFDILSSEGD